MLFQVHCWLYGTSRDINKISVSLWYCLTCCCLSNLLLNFIYEILRTPFLYNTANDWFSLSQETSFMLKYLLPHLLETGPQKGLQKLKGLWISSFLLVTSVYFKVHTSHSNFQICWSMKILLWSVNIDQNWILITSTNSKIVVTNQFHLCNGSFSWAIQLQLITLEKELPHFSYWVPTLD